jgi:predicted RND superfamily exporter protein
VANERVHIVPWLVLALFGVALAIYRRLALAIAALLPGLAGIVWTGGAIALLGQPLDPVAALLEPVLLTIGVAASVHFVEAWRRARAGGLDARAAVDAARRDQIQPAFLATATTKIGLLALCTSPVPAVIDFGAHAAFGVALVHAFTFLLLPAWLPFAAGGVPRPEEPRLPLHWLAGLERHRLPALATTIALTCLGLAALPSLRADNDPLQLLPAHDATRVDHDTLAARLGGVELFHLLLAARTPGTDPGRLLPFLAGLQQQPGIAGLGGPVQRGTEGDLAVPVLLTPSGSGVRGPLFDEIERAGRVMGMGPTLPVGAAVQIVRDSERLMHSLLGSLWLTLALLAGGMCIGLRSVRLGLLGVIPNLIPCIWIYGALAEMGRPVSVATAMIASTMLGLIVDNTLHLLHHYRVAAQRSEPRLAVVRALRQCGRGMLLSSTMLFVGFAVTMTSHLTTTVEFSLLACSIIAVALFTSAVVLPMLLVRRPAIVRTEREEVARAV